MESKLIRLSKKCKKIKLVLTDVDGVLTDGGMYYSEKGEIFKKFNTRDGMAVELLRDNKIPVIFITREKSKIVLQRAKKLSVQETFIGVEKKILVLPKICLKYNVKKYEIAYVGDDINDLEIMKNVGLSASPKNGISIIKKNSDYICKLQSGQGVLREVADLILKFKN
jgi:YrbI family 3-deoxy-D-manno-octulosonate 8-phosphate phosphatase